MGQQTKGGMWCDYCNRPVLAVKNTHRMRNIVSVALMPATGFMSTAGLKVQGYRCPNCGSSVSYRWGRPQNTGPPTGPIVQAAPTTRSAPVVYDLHDWSPEKIDKTLARVKDYCIPYRWDPPRHILTIPAKYDEAMNKLVLREAR